jgi:hypothetical protein
MKKHHLFAFYCTLLVPIGALIGAGIGSTVGFQVLSTILGAAAGISVSYVVMRSSDPAETS